MKYIVPGTPEWHEARAGSIGGSDAGVLCRYNGFKGVIKLYKEKAGLQPSDYSENRFTRWGHLAEPGLIVRLAQMLGEVVLGRMWDGRAAYFYPDGGINRLVHPTQKWLMNPIHSKTMKAHVNLDAVSMGPPPGPDMLPGWEVPTSFWDCKNTGRDKKLDWKECYGPNKYVAQIAHGGMILKEHDCDIPGGLIALIGGNLDVMSRVPHIQTLEDELRERITRFSECVATGTVPKVNTMFPRLPDAFSIKQEEVEVAIMGGKGGSESKFTYPPFPEGTEQGIIVDMIDRGIEENTYNGETKKKHKCRVVVLFPNVLLPEVDDSGVPLGELAGKPRTVSEFLTVSWFDMANMRKWAGALRGHDLTDAEDVLAEEKRLDAEEVLMGLNGLFGVRNKKNGWPEITTYAKPMKGMPLFELKEMNYVRMKDRNKEQQAPEPAQNDDDLPF